MFACIVDKMLWNENKYQFSWPVAPQWRPVP
jgi:hypothetical protein